MTLARIATIAAAALTLAGCVAPPPPMAPPGAPIVYGSYCSAGVYQCNIAQALPVGTSCACPGLGAPSYGTVR